VVPARLDPELRAAVEPRAALTGLVEPPLDSATALPEHTLAMATWTDEHKAAQVAKRRRKSALAAAAAGYESNEANRRKWETNGTRLSREEFDAGVSCRGCGLPIIDGLGDRPPLLKLMEAERAEFDASDADDLARHRSCQSHR
jgi:hypothetical protein